MKQQVLVRQEDDGSWTAVQGEVFIQAEKPEKYTEVKKLDLAELLPLVLNLESVTSGASSEDAGTGGEEVTAERAVPVWVRWQSYQDAMVDNGMSLDAAGVAGALLAVVDYLEMHLRVQEKR